jgi:hypothetical protein
VRRERERRQNSRILSRTGGEDGRQLNGNRTSTGRVSKHALTLPKPRVRSGRDGGGDTFDDMDDEYNGELDK